MRIEDAVTRPGRFIREVVDSLERHGKYDFGHRYGIRIERWKDTRAFEAYRHTLMGMPGKLEGEPPSATMVTKATVKWRLEPAEIGYRVRQTHVGTVHPAVRPCVEAWFKAGRPYPSSGGFYYTIPNKSYTRVKDLAKYPELRDAVLNLQLEDEWLRFWDIYLPLRYDVSRQMLHALKTGADKEVFSRHNEEAGTGLAIRGRRLKRKDLATVSTDLDFLLDYAFLMGVAFAAVQIAQLPPGHVFLVDVYNHYIKGAVASRSDMDVLDTAYDGEHLTVEGIAQTRQAGSDASGVLSNSDSERRMMGSSVTEAVLRKYKRDNVEYPFTSKDKLLEVWSHDAKPFPNKRYVIGQDLGLTEPTKSPADALFSRGFLKLAGKVIPMMLSGSGWTQAVYSVFQNHFASKLPPGDFMMALGDDLTTDTATATEDIFAPYIKVKGSDPEQNSKKILGLYTSFSVQPDPDGRREALIGVVPRVIKTVSSATKRSTLWGESLSNLDPAGTRDFEHNEATILLVQKDLPVILPYMMWKGPRSQLLDALKSLWGVIPRETWNALVRHNEEIEYRLRPDVEETGDE